MREKVEMASERRPRRAWRAMDEVQETTSLLSAGGGVRGRGRGRGRGERIEEGILRLRRGRGEGNGDRGKE